MASPWMLGAKSVRASGWKTQTAPAEQEDSSLLTVKKTAYVVCARTASYIVPESARKA